MCILEEMGWGGVGEAFRVILFVLEAANSLTSHSFVPVFFPRILEGEIT